MEKELNPFEKYVLLGLLFNIVTVTFSPARGLNHEDLKYSLKFSPMKRKLRYLPDFSYCLPVGRYKGWEVFKLIPCICAIIRITIFALEFSLWQHLKIVLRSQTTPDILWTSRISYGHPIRVQFKSEYPWTYFGHPWDIKMSKCYPELNIHRMS